MGRAIGSLLAGVDLHHARHVERVDAGEGIRGDQDDTGVGVDFILHVPQLDGLEHYGASAYTGACSAREGGSWHTGGLVQM